MYNIWNLKYYIDLKKNGLFVFLYFFVLDLCINKSSKYNFNIIVIINYRNRKYLHVQNIQRRKKNWKNVLSTVGSNLVNLHLY